MIIDAAAAANINFNRDYKNYLRRANGKLYFELLGINSAAQNHLPHCPQRHGENALRSRRFLLSISIIKVGIDARSFPTGVRSFPMVQSHSKQVQGHSRQMQSRSRQVQSHSQWCKVIPNRCKVIPNRCKVVPNRCKVVPNGSKVVPNF